MRQQQRSLLRRSSRVWSLATSLSCLGAAFAWGCQFDDSGFHLDQDSGATSSRGGSSSTSSTGGKGHSGSVTAEAGKSGSGVEPIGGSTDGPPEYPAPTVDSMEPASGPYGTLVTIKGEWLGNVAQTGFTLAVGNQGEVTLTPKDKSIVQSWTDEEITFRYPFPAEGAIVLEAPKGDVMVGDFQPTWHVAQEIEKAPAVTVLASISPVKDHIEMLFDTKPLTLLDVGPDGAVGHTVTATGVDPTSVRLYLDAKKKVQGIGVSTDAAPVLVELQNDLEDLVAKPTTIKLQATEFAIAGGASGASAWMRRANGWFRARPGAAGWAQDKGPIAEPNPDAPDRASGVSSDGSLFVAYSVDTGNFLDDTEAAYMQKLDPMATKFSAGAAAGSSVDDYVTELTLTSSGDGLVVRTCGSDVDPFGLSGTTHYCFDSLHAASGAHLFNVPVDQKSIAHAFTPGRAVAAYCTGDSTWMIETDADVQTAPGTPIGESVLYPCPEAVALEVNGEGDYLPVVRWGSKTYLIERNPSAPTP